MQICCLFQASGDWSGRDPQCVAFSIVGIATITLTAISTMVIIATCITCCCLNANSIKVALFMLFNLSFGQRLGVHKRLHDVFVMFNHESKDQFFVLDEILPLLSKHRLNPVIEDCFALGCDKFTCLQNIMTHSRSALVILTTNLLKVNWNLYQLNQAVCTQLEQHNFKVVFLVCAKPNELGNIPENLQLFLRTGSSIEKYKNNWKGRLIYELKHNTKRSVSKRLTFGNTELNGVNLNKNNELSVAFDSRMELSRINMPTENQGKLWYGEI